MSVIFHSKIIIAVSQNLSDSQSVNALASHDGGKGVAGAVWGLACNIKLRHQFIEMLSIIRLTNVGEFAEWFRAGVISCLNIFYDLRVDRDSTISSGFGFQSACDDACVEIHITFANIEKFLHTESRVE